ncbi:MAG: ribonuclease H-like domain-containing protein, partial [Anaerolineae bacterium]|nr:ribonuclease H-like domain-containing protein [Anaerolineae bacterium]
MPIFFDIETQNTFQEVGGRYPERLNISVAVTYDTRDQAFHRYTEADAQQLALDLAQADLVVGYNTYGFDYPVLQRYTEQVVLADLPSVDMMLELQKKLGFRPRLDSVASATLHIGKSADGLQAVRWWREGKIEEIFTYCEQDVAVTRDVYLYGKTNRFVQYLDRQYRVQKILV